MFTFCVPINSDSSNIFWVMDSLSQILELPSYVISESSMTSAVDTRQQSLSITSNAEKHDPMKTLIHVLSLWSLSWPAALSWLHISRVMTKPTKWVCAQRRLSSAWRIRSVWSESSLCAQWVAKYPRFLHADSEDSDQTGQMPRLIWVFAGRTLT